MIFLDKGKTKLNAALGGFFTGNLPESAAVCAFAIDNSENNSSHESSDGDFSEAFGTDDYSDANEN